MPHLKTETVYHFDELGDTAKARARDWYREGDTSFTDFYAETVIEDVARLCTMIGIDLDTMPVKLMNGTTRRDPKVYYSGFCSQGDGASFAGSYGYKKGSVQALAKEAPTGEGDGYEGNNEINRIAKELQDVQRRHFYRVQARITHESYAHYSHEMTMRIEVERADEQEVSTADTQRVVEALRDVARWIYRQLEREYEYQTSDEQVDETIRTNAYEFDEDGRRA